VVASPPARTNGPSLSGGAGGRVDVEWDDEELATNIYDAPHDASDAVVDDRPDLSEVELSADGSPVPHPSRAPAPSPSAKPIHELASLPTAISKPGRNGTGSRSNPFDFVLPEAAQPAPSSEPVTGPALRSPPARAGRAVLYGAAAGIVALASLTTFVIYHYVVGSRPGEVTILSDPATNVQVLLDNKRMLDAKGVAIDGTPAVIPLKAGSYVVTVQREGYVPYNEKVELNGGDRVTVRARLERLASTGFTLMSDPPGATAVLDGRPLDGLTPLRVEWTPGRHHIDVRNSVGSWSQDFTIEAGKMLELHAVVGQAALPPKLAEKPAPPLPPAAPAAREEPLKPIKLAAADHPIEKLTATRPPKEDKKPVQAAKKAAAETHDDSDLPPPTKPKAAAAAAPAPAKSTAAPAPATKPTASASTPTTPAPAKPAAAASTTAAPAPTKPAATTAAPAPTKPAATAAAPAPTKPAAAPAAKSGAASSSSEGILRIGSKPWTNIAIDGKDTGLHTPQTNIKLSPGTHRVTLSNPQFNVKQTFSVDIKAGETETVRKDLTPQKDDDSD
jgi:hypothetical protein